MDIIVNESKHEGLRLDKVLVDLVPDKTRTYLLKMIEEEKILVNGKPFKPSQKAVLGDKITILDIEPKPLEVKAEDLNLDIVYEDSDVAVVNKPKGMVVHPGAGNYDATLVNGLLYELSRGSNSATPSASSSTPPSRNGASPTPINSARRRA